MHDADMTRAWLNQAGRIPMLTAAEELHLGGLVRAWLDHPAGRDGAPAGVKRRGKRARDRLIRGNLRLVASIARKMRHHRCLGGLEFADLLQEGAVGLSRGAELFDPARGYKFSTFGYWWVRQAIGRAIHEKSRLIRVPVHLSEGKAKSPELVAAAAAVEHVGSIDAPTSHGDGCSLADLLAAPDEHAAEEERLEVIQQAAADVLALVDRDTAAALEMRAEGENAQAIGEAWGVSRTCAQGRLNTAKARLREVPGLRERVGAALAA